MAELKTRKNDDNVEAFLNTVESEEKKKDCFTILEMMEKITGETPKMWGTSIIGFGDHHYKYKTGREGDWFNVGFAPRKQNISLYIMTGFKKYDELMSRLGKFKTGKSCLYIKKLEDVDINILEQLIALSSNWIKNKKWE